LPTVCPSVQYSKNPSSLNLAEYNIFNQLLCSEQVRYKKIIYESDNEEIKKLIPYFIIALMVLLCVVLIYKQPKSL